MRDMATLIELFGGEDCVIFASDWPHHDFDHPDKVLQIPLSDEARRKVMGRKRRPAARNRGARAMKTEHDRLRGRGDPAGRAPRRRGRGPPDRHLQHRRQLLRAPERVLPPERPALPRDGERHAAGGRAERLQAEWRLDGEVIVCPWHSLEFHVKTGQSIAYPDRRLPTYPVRVEDGLLRLTL